jgi:putative heme-binding domain-containing protein
VKAGKQQVAAAIVATWWNESAAVEFARKTAADNKASEADRVALLKALGDLKDESNLTAIAAVFNDNTASIAVRKAAAEALGTLGGADAAKALLANFKTIPQELKPACINNVTGSVAVARVLLDALESKQVSPSEINSNNARAVVGLNDAELTKRLTAAWGKVRTEAERDPARLQVVDKLRKAVVAHKAGDALKGWKVFEKNCQQCHSIYGKGTADLGPNLTGVGRENLDAILKNVLDPNDTVGDIYKQYMVKTKDGKVISGLPDTRSEKTLSLKVAGGKIEQISIAEIALEKQTQLSLMPEELEKTMTEDEFCDLVAFLLTKTEPKQ